MASQRVRIHADRVEVPPSSALPGGGNGGLKFVPHVTILSNNSVGPLPSANVADDFSRTTLLEMELAAAQPAIVNTLRRVIATEVPTMAIDRVDIHRNDGVVLDEMLAHRLGLVPLAVDDIDSFEMLTVPGNYDRPNGKYIIKFTLNVDAKPGVAITPVHSSDLKWVRLEGQDEHKAYRPVHADILLAKLGPGQGISLEAYAVKGIGLLHNKWSPVSACWYDMRTTVKMNGRLCGAAAQKLQSICPKKVFGVTPAGDAAVINPNACSVCRECLGQPEKFEDYVAITKETDRVVFYVESLGQYANAFDIVHAALRLFANRCRSLAQDVAASQSLRLEPAAPPTKEEEETAVNEE